MKYFKNYHGETNWRITFALFHCCKKKVKIKIRTLRKELFSHFHRNSMNSISRNSPRKNAFSATSRMMSEAEEFINGRDVSTVNQNDIPTIIQSLQAFRHKAMISDDKSRQKRCENLISEFNLQLNKNDQHTPKIGRQTQRSVKSPDKSSQTGKPTIELTEKEYMQMNTIIDSLLDGCEIDSIEPYAIPKLDFVLRKRKAQAMEDRNYIEAKLLDEQINKLNKLSSRVRFVFSSQSKTVERLLKEAKIKLKNAEQALEKIQYEYEDELNKIAADKDKAQASIFEQIEKDLSKIEEERAEIDMGFGYKPSRFLLDMRLMENKFATNSLFDEAAEQRKKADRRETEERKEFDRRAKKAFEAKERQLRASHQQKIQASNQFWDNFKEKVQKKYDKKIASAEAEIKSTTRWIKKLQGEADENNQSDEPPIITENDVDSDNENENNVDNENHIENESENENQIENESENDIAIEKENEEEEEIPELAEKYFDDDKDNSFLDNLNSRENEVSKLKNKGASKTKTTKKTGKLKKSGKGKAKKARKSSPKSTESLQENTEGGECINDPQNIENEDPAQNESTNQPPQKKPPRKTKKVIKRVTKKSVKKPQK